ncbi:MAG: right-handed parallel beta-helix repeat-containing protein, partial [Myxococcota bacterium]
MWIVFAAASAANLNVDPSNPSAYQTIQAAIDAANPSDTIAIQPGTYPDCVDTSGKDLTLQGVAGPAMTAIRVESLCPGQGFASSSAIVVENGETVRITGLTLYGRGGALWANGADVTLDSVVLDGSNTLGDPVATGVQAQSSTLTVRDSTFSNHFGFLGAAISTWNTDVVIRDSQFTANHAEESGGAIDWAADNAVSLDIERTTFEANLADGNDGGAISALEPAFGPLTATVRIVDSRFVGNGPGVATGPLMGGAVRLTRIGDVTVSGNVFERNLAPNGGGALLVVASEEVAVVGNHFCDNGARFFSGGAAWSLGNRSERWSRNVFLANNGELSNDGAGLAVEDSQGAVVEQNTFVGNAQQYCLQCGGAALYGAETSMLTVRNNLFTHSSGAAAVHFADATTDGAASVTFNAFFLNGVDIGGAASFSPTAEGNQIVAPQFVSLQLDDDCGNDNLMLQPGSPLVDAGAPGTLDPDGSPADIGAYGGGVAPSQSWSIPSPGASGTPGRMAGLVSSQSSGTDTPSRSTSSRSEPSQSWSMPSYAISTPPGNAPASPSSQSVSSPTNPSGGAHA